MTVGTLSANFESRSVALFERVGRIFYFLFLMDTERHVAERIRIGGVGA